MADKDYSTEANATIRKWQRIREKDEQDYESARKGLYAFFEKAVSNDKVRQRLDYELRESRRRGGSLPVNNESGYNLVKDDYDPIVDGGEYNTDKWREDD